VETVTNVGEAAGRRGSLFFGSLVLIIAGLRAYWPSLRGTWLWDDDLEIAGNRTLREAGGWWRTWVRPEGQDYYPLKTSFQWLEWHLWGDRVLGYHLVNLGLHLLGAFLLWRVLARLAGNWPGFWGGLIFALHPVCVGSVAWISELKNVMSLPLLLLAMLAWMDFDEVAEAARLSRNACAFRYQPYRMALVCFTAAMLCKASVVMFPVVLLLYAWWRRGRIGWADLRVTLPFFAVSLALGGVTIWFQTHRAIAGSIFHLGRPAWRLGSTGMAIVFYFTKAVLPVRLEPIYPDWGAKPVWLRAGLCWAVIAAVAAYLWRRRAGFGRPALFGLAFFVINLLPVLGLIPMSYMRISRVADHLCYLPLVGITGLEAAWLAGQVERCAGRTPRRIWGPAIAAAICLAFAFCTSAYARNFRDPQSFWTYAARQNPRAWPALGNLGTLSAALGQVDQARDRYEQALRVKPDYAEAENGLGLVCLQKGKPGEAFAHFNRAIQLKPDYAEAYSHRGLINAYLSLQSQALADFEKGEHLKPDSAECQLNFGFGLARFGRLEEAIGHYRRAIALRPDFPQAHFNLGNALLRLGKPSDAIPEYEAALRFQPDYQGAKQNLQVARQRLKSKR
jgi:Tfp pilus assembly protein PilF